MIQSLEVKNLFGFSYTMKLNAGRREDNSFELKGQRLFATYQVGSGGRDYELFKHALNAVELMKHMHDPELEEFCNVHLNGIESSVEIHFYYLDTQEDVYRKGHYKLVFNTHSIIEEVIDGRRIIPEMRQSPFQSFMPMIFSDYFDLVIMYDITNKTHKAELRVILFEALDNAPFRKFVLQVLNMCNESAVNIYKDEHNEVVVKYVDGTPIPFDQESEEVRTLCLLSWVMFIALRKSGVIVIENIDAVVKYDNILNLLQLFHESEAMSYKKAQLIISAAEPNFNLYPEQMLTVQEDTFGTEKLKYCTWQNY